MKKIITKALCLSAFVFPQWGVAENLLEVLQQAKQADPIFLGAGYERAAVGETLEQATARMYPSLTLSAERKQTDQDIARADNTVFATGETDFSTRTLSATLTQPVFNYESTMRIEQAKVAKGRSDIEFDKAYQDLLLRVSEAYFEQLKAREQLAAIASEKEALKRHYDYAKKSFEAGITREAEATDAEARYLSSLAQEIEYQRNYEDARYKLMEIIGRLPSRLAPMREVLPLVLPEPARPSDWIAMGLVNNPDILIPKQNLEEARYEIKAQNGGHFPRLDFVINQYSQDTDGSLFGGGSDVDTTEIAVKLEMPIYQGGAVSSRKREAKQRMYKSREDVALAQRTIETQAQSAFQGIVATMAQITALKKTVFAQQSVLENKEKGFQSGLYSIIAVLDAQQDLANAQQSYVAARNDYAINYVRLKRAAGVLEETDLATINGWLEAQ